MTIVTVQVEIPEGWELACDVLREPERGEHYLNLFGYVCEKTSELSAGRRPIVHLA